MNAQPKNSKPKRLFQSHECIPHSSLSAREVSESSFHDVYCAVNPISRFQSAMSEPPATQTRRKAVLVTDLGPRFSFKTNFPSLDRKLKTPAEAMLSKSHNFPLQTNAKRGKQWSSESSKHKVFNLNSTWSHCINQRNRARKNKSSYEDGENKKKKSL